VRESRLSSSVVICTLNRPDDIRRCVDALGRQTRPPEQVVVIDAGDLQDTRRQLAQSCEEAGIEFKYAKDEPSTTRQRNAGARIASGSVLFFLDDDVEIAEDYISRLMSLYEKDTEGRIGGITGVPEPAPAPESGFWKWYQRFFLLAETRAGARPGMKRSHFPVHGTGFVGVDRCEIMPSTAVSYRAQVFQEFEFDGNLGGYVMAEDLDLAWRVSRVHELWTDAGAVYRHKKSEVSRNSRRETEKRRILFTQYFFRKNMGGSVTCWLARCWALLGMSVRYAYLAVRRRDSQLLLGFRDGIVAAARNKLLLPGRFVPGRLEH